jgi:predicted dienelactone hydrolase
VDVLQTKEGEPNARYDRAFTIEVWYPAVLAAGQSPGGVYRTAARDPARPIDLHGRAVRDAAPAAPPSGGHPLVIVSHGYPGNRYLLSHLAENLASKGFVVAALDHPDSTYDDPKAFASTLYNRPLDQLFVLDELDRLSRAGSGSFLAGVADVSRTALVGYSMGGYGVLNSLGAGFSEAAVTARAAPPNRLLHERAAANPAFQRRADPRIKAAIAIAPYGGALGTWDAEALRAITTPVLFVAGSADEVVGYEKGVRALFLGASQSDRYLLTFLNGSHNVGAPIPAPAEAWAYSDTLKLFPFVHYADAVWDSVRGNNVLQHFAAAFLAVHLKGDASGQAYLDLVPRGADGVQALDREGRPPPAHTYWKGFKPRTAVGLVLEHLPAGK